MISTDAKVVAYLLAEVMASLTTLDLQFNNIGKEGGVAIAKALGVNASMTSLDLRYIRSLDDQTKANLRSAAKSTLKLEL